ncbi:roadblock/LC7 domain-containing protein [Hydrogenophaga sp. PBL-H3]|uniref:roadblock/LC7 domain-containing protein n=1 Tax=Hydrogenophaga sp. PBL-H3 TaxID=434010 RepID=UPI0013202B33|nr:roadblock/LC7 domain-containing protein [Hydrogenophaga sp. PBL-H3]QHE76239.1 hypothetical protein F9Z45_09305 [Hydrogenophaga sp. PBL-H3]QHE80663.1 hypothetical protein F9Z44_09305 [Hydrogenophaga sp. PBL-H3]
MSEAIHLPLVTIARFADLLGALMRDTPGVVSVTLASADGLTVTSTLSNSREADRLSAMAGSMGGLAAALSRESGHGTPHRMIMESAQGLILAMAVPRPAGELVLTVVTDAQAVLGKLLWSCRQTVDRLAAT